MTTDLPVLVGVGQVTIRVGDIADARSPLDLMAEATHLAATDTGKPEILQDVDSVQVVNVISWPTTDPAADLATRLGMPAGERVYTSIGGNTPQWLVNRTARRLALGEIRAALLVGAEAMHSVRLAQKQRAELPWPPRGRPEPNAGDTRPGVNALEARHGAMLPVRIYPLFENAIRAARRWGIEEHRAKLGHLGERFSAVAAGNPHAWFRQARTAGEIMTVGPANRMVGFPYPKFLNAIIEVDQGAAVLMTTESFARELGIPRERWVYLHGFGQATDAWFISDRATYHESPAIAAAGSQAFSMAHTEIQQVEHVDLYSCFPAAVQFGRDALGIGLDDPRPLTVTGGLACFGGPGNNYSMHAIATMCEKLRSAPATRGLVSAMGWYSTKHAVGIYGASRPEGDWQPADPAPDQRQLDAQPHPAVVEHADGAGTVETYTVAYSRDGEPEQAIIIGRTDDGARFWANGPTDTAHIAALTSEEGVGLRGRVSPGDATGVNHFDW